MICHYEALAPEQSPGSLLEAPSLTTGASGDTPGYNAGLSVASGRLWESGLPSTLKAATMQLAQASQHGLGIVSLPASTWTPHAMMDHVDGGVYAEAARRLEIEILPQQLRVVCGSANGSLYQWTQ